MAKPFRPKHAEGLQTDAEKLETARELSKLAKVHMPRAIEVVAEVMNDPKSRQRLDAARTMVEFATGGDIAGAATGGGTKVLVVNGHDLDAIENEMRAKRALPATIDEEP